jgi:GTP-dependent phosphoenolpyruvate carboxykinase
MRPVVPRLKSKVAVAAFSLAAYARILSVAHSIDVTAWRKEVMTHEKLFINLHDHLPPEMIYERELLICRL